ncbi:exopolysaccharide biosynthesis protein [Leptolyngbya sp. FACHB-261]|uniref:exopolysaccharide biosynthesis protein n=1 Tax=Leptolyngbya sp. FACHB-261 TaxID=2692806 RepID=UPI00168245D4|nr:exopolysaccharide biosynthesis protein [Leptolyngbya sp. FACHB-261]MBD2100312.1 exopolysaccharide biosynthesis protein [Leptolyngbya sp. FACHB-261]
MSVTSSPPRTLQTSRLLRRFLQQHRGDSIRLRDLFQSMGSRAFGPTLLVCSLPEALPLPIAGVSAIFGIPLMLVSAQLILGFSKPWLPGWIANRSFKRVQFEKIINKGLHYLEKIERLVQPRWRFATTPGAERLLGLLLLVLAIVIALPIPFANMLPAIAILLISLGMIEGDGALIVVGVLSSCVLLAVLVGAISTLVPAGKALLAKLLAKLPG